MIQKIKRLKVTSPTNVDGSELARLLLHVTVTGEMLKGRHDLGVITIVQFLLDSPEE